MQFAEHLLLVQSVALESFFGQGVGAKNMKFRFGAEMVRKGVKNSRRVRAAHPCQYHTFAVCHIECFGVQ